MVTVCTVPGVRTGFPSMSRGIAMTSSDTLSGTTMRGLRSTYCSSILRFCRRRREGWLRPRVSYRSLRFHRDGSENRRFGNRNGRGGDFPPRPLFAGTFPYFSGTGAFFRWLLSVFPAAEEAENDVGIRKRTERERKVPPGDPRQWSFRSKGGQLQREKKESGLPDTRQAAGMCGAIRYFIRSNPVKGTSAAGMRMPSGVWLFSSSAATMRGRASELPLRVWANWIFRSASR